MMKKMIQAGGICCILGLLFSCGTDKHNTRQDYAFRDVPFTQVHCTDQFWAPRIETIRTVTVPYAFKKCEETGRIDNFAIAAGVKEGRFKTTYPFDDSDVYKIIEGASFLLAVQKDDRLDHYLDSLITLIGKAQETDGYLYTNRTINNPPHPWIGKGRWENEWDNSHETYNAGHLYEAAAAHYQATGKRSLLDIAIRNADLMCATFNENGLNIAPGHEVIEMGLVKLYRVTENKKYLDLSRFFLEARGKSTRFDKNSEDIFRNGKYWQDHLPVTQQREAVGHAVRGTYLYSAMADIAAITNDPDYLTATDSIWANITGKKMYITGGIGSTAHGEAFGRNYELPNESAYCETCAAIGNCMFNHRMFMLHGDAKYIDVLERSLYNGVLSGIDFSGDKFFYPNPLNVNKFGQVRSPWFNCSCCPSNLARFIPSVPGYMYATDDESVYINLFAGNQGKIKIKDQEVYINQQTSYPWSGDVLLTVDPQGNSGFGLKIRIPGWAQNEATPTDLYSYVNPNDSHTEISINGNIYDYKIEKGYAVVRHKWKTGDQVSISFPMQAHMVRANDQVDAARDRLSVEYGPIVYCAEFADNSGPVGNMVLPKYATFTASYDAGLLQGVNVLKSKAVSYLPVGNTKELAGTPVDLTLVPYYARSHRGNGEMTVWLPVNPDIIKQKHLAAYRIVDEVKIGDEESEKRHTLKGHKTNTGGTLGWRDASDGGWFSYNMQIVQDEPVELVLTYSSLDGGNRFFEILADGHKIGEQKLRTETFNAMVDRTYAIPVALTKGKKSIEIRIKSMPGNIAGGIWGCKVCRTNI